MDNSFDIVIEIGTARSTFESCQGQVIFLFYKIVDYLWDTVNRIFNE